MKKISYIELSTITISIIISMNLGININILVNDVGNDSWISIIISYIIGIIPLLLTLYISNYKQNLNLYEKNRYLCGNLLGNIINIYISLILFIAALILLNNIIDFITTQFLYRTPIILTATIFIALIIYCSTKEINVIAHVSIILMLINLLIFIITGFSLINEIKLDNLLPILTSNTSKLILSAFKLTCINILPIIIISIIPKEKITNKEKYNKWIIISYLIGGIISLITTIITISVLGIHLTKIFEYPEYMVLKKVKLFGFLERTENIISIKWITETYIYLTLIIYSLSKCITIKNKNTFNILNIIIGILLIITTRYLFNNITIFKDFVSSKFIYIVCLIIPFYLLIPIKIFINKKNNLS